MQNANNSFRLIEEMVEFVEMRSSSSVIIFSGSIYFYFCFLRRKDMGRRPPFSGALPPPFSKPMPNERNQSFPRSSFVIAHTRRKIGFIDPVISRPFPSTHESISLLQTNPVASDRIESVAEKKCEKSLESAWINRLTMATTTSRRRE